ncbi:MAG: homoserine dehydrogenase [Gemmataceae bacterium]|nr:homoserine dehydrogenase [Gemmataceae bacterium]MCI0740749.1 homoserine dehydrogenase [Gemmataceae bacterium]
MEPLDVALIGCGTVGSGVAQILLEHPERITARAGRPIRLARVVVKDPTKPRPNCVPSSIVTTDLRKVLDDPAIHVAVEVVGGVDWARRAVLDLLAAGKDVVTANKALLALHGAEVFDAGRRHKKAVAFEASVGGGIPIIGALSHGLAANQILSLQGILNGTCNFILTGMTENGTSYAAALAEAQKRGYAEANPTLDVDGTDAAHKLAILAQIAFGANVPFSAITRRGIAGIHQNDIRYAKELGYTIKLLAEAWLDRDPKATDNGGGQLALHVSPVMLRHLTPLAQVRDAYNAVFVLGDAVGSTLYYGRGAGQMPTASAVVADLIDLAAGRAQRTFEALRLWSGKSNGITLKPTSEVPSRFYLRLMVEDKPGVLAEVARILANHEISISSVIQHEGVESPEGDIVPLIIMTHTARTGNFTSTIAEFDRLESVTAPSVYYPVGD